jgi:hypothetical protein
VELPTGAEIAVGGTSHGAQAGLSHNANAYLIIGSASPMAARSDVRLR